MLDRLSRPYRCLILRFLFTPIPIIQQAASPTNTVRAIHAVRRTFIARVSLGQNVPCSGTVLTVVLPSERSSSLFFVLFMPTP